MRFDHPDYLASLALADPQRLWKEHKKHMNVAMEHLTVANFIEGLLEKQIPRSAKQKAKAS